MNPSFGGNAFNSAHLLALAESQKAYEEAEEDNTRDPVGDFSRTVTSSVLNRVASQIADSIYGENRQDSGSFTVGDTQIDFQTVGDQVVINIRDFATGSSTTVEVPVPQL